MFILESCSSLVCFIYLSLVLWTNYYRMCYIYTASQMYFVWSLVNYLNVPVLTITINMKSHEFILVYFSMSLIAQFDFRINTLIVKADKMSFNSLFPIWRLCFVHGVIRTCIGPCRKQRCQTGNNWQKDCYWLWVEKDTLWVIVSSSFSVSL